MLTIPTAADTPQNICNIEMKEVLSTLRNLSLAPATKLTRRIETEKVKYFGETQERRMETS